MRESILNAAPPMTGNVAEISLPASVRSSFSQLADEQLHAAQHGLQTYMNDGLDAYGAPAFTAQLRSSVSEDADAVKRMALECAFSGMMTPEEFNEYEVPLRHMLAAHTVLSRYNPSITCTRQEDGHVCLSAAVVGLSVDDYARLIQSLAEIQYKQDAAAANNNSRHDDAHTVHEKMTAAVTGMKALIHKELQEHLLPDLNQKQGGVKPKKPKHQGVPNTHLAGLMDRKNGQPVMGALTAAFHKRRRGGVLHDGHTGDDHHLLDMLEMHQAGTPSHSISGAHHMGMVDHLRSTLGFGSEGKN
jgi:hypothetical protein